MSNIDDKIVELIKVVEKQKEEVAETEKNSKRGWKTNCSLSIVGFPQPLNLQTASIEQVVKAYGILLTLTNNIESAARDLSVSTQNTYEGFSVSDWVEDFKKRVAMIELKAKKDKLNTLETRLNGIVSPEIRRQMELETIMKELGQ